MLEAVLAGDGVPAVARLASEALDGTVIVALPALDLLSCAPDADDRRGPAVQRHVEDRRAPTPIELAAESPVVRGGEPLGSVVLLGARRRGGGDDAEPVLRLAALAVLTALALDDGGAPAQADAGALFDALRRDAGTEAILARAADLGRDLRYGGVVISAVPARGTLQPAVAAITQDAPDAVVHATGSRVEAIVPHRLPGHAGRDATDLARRAARRLTAQGAVGLSAPESDPADLGRALREAELVLALAAGGAGELDPLQSGTWRLLTRMAVMVPGEVERIATTALGPLLDPELRSGPALLDTLTTYVETGANMRATAAAGFAHRHTVAYRLERVLELTGHDPRKAEGLEQLTLGLKARAVRDALQAGR